MVWPESSACDLRPTRHYYQVGYTRAPQRVAPAMRLLVAASAALVLALAPAELAVRAAAPEGDGLQEFENCYIGTRHVHTWRRRCCPKLASYLSRLASKTCEAARASVSALRGGAGVHGATGICC